MWSAGSFRDPPGRGGGVAATMEARLVKKLRLIRAARGAVIALVLALIAAAPAAAAAPTKTVLHPTFDHYQADESGCGFAVDRVFNSGARITILDFTNGRETSR